MFISISLTGYGVLISRKSGLKKGPEWGFWYFTPVSQENNIVHRWIRSSQWLKFSTKCFEEGVWGRVARVSLFQNIFIWPYLIQS